MVLLQVKVHSLKPLMCLSENKWDTKNDKGKFMIQALLK